MEQKALDKSLLNIDLFLPSENTLKTAGLKEVTSLAIFEPKSDVFNKEGLFSQEIFGQVGSDARFYSMGYTSFKVKVLHPLIFETICSLGEKYKKIMSGKLKCRFDPETKDFVPDEEEGETGYSFFIKYLDEIEYKQTSSSKRDRKLELIKKYGKREAMISEFLIIPAGLRDYTVDEKGNPSEDEINPLYRTLIGLSNRMKTVTLTPEIMYLIDPVRFKIQETVYNIFKYIYALIDGKKKFIQNKFASRAIAYSTRNVITYIPSRITNIDNNKNKVNFNTTTCGLYQALKALGPVTYNKLISTYLMDIQDPETSKVMLIDPKTYQLVSVDLTTKSKVTWSTSDGVNGTLNKFVQDEVFNEFVMIDKHYLFLVLDLDDEVYIGNLESIFSDLQSNYNGDPKVDRLLGMSVEQYVNGGWKTTLKDKNTDRLRPIRYSELFYTTIAPVTNNHPALVTRYPITGHGSIYPSDIHLETTLSSRKVRVNISNSLTKFDTEKYPIFEKNNKYFRSMSVHYIHLGTLGADHDGDMTNFTPLFTEEAVKEAKNIMNNKDFYMNSLGNSYFTPGNHVLDITLKHMTAKE